MTIYLLNLLRLVHVVAGILWAGAAISYLFFVKPSVQSIGAAGPQFMQSLMERRKYPLFMVSMSLLTVLAITMALLASLTVLPQLLVVIKPFGKERQAGANHKENGA